MQAAYSLIDDATLDRLLDLHEAALSQALEAIEAEGATVYLDKTWDGLHFLLTGTPAADPIEDDPLSEAVVGVHVVQEDDFVGCTEVDELPAIIAALEAVGIQEALAAADFTAFARAGVTPRMWAGDPASLRAELADAFATLLDVHRRARDAGAHLLVSIL